VHVSLLDDRGEFYEQLRVKIVHEGADFVVTVTRANVVANTCRLHQHFAAIEKRDPRTSNSPIAVILSARS